MMLTHGLIYCQKDMHQGLTKKYQMFILVNGVQSNKYLNLVVKKKLRRWVRDYFFLREYS